MTSRSKLILATGLLSVVLIAQVIWVHGRGILRKTQIDETEIPLSAELSDTPPNEFVLPETTISGDLIATPSGLYYQANGWCYTPQKAFVEGSCVDLMKRDKVQ